MYVDKIKIKFKNININNDDRKTCLVCKVEKQKIDNSNEKKKQVNYDSANFSFKGMRTMKLESVFEGNTARSYLP